jgi:flagellar motor switch protein FliM
VTVDSNLIYSIVDVLLGGRRGTNALRVEGRPYTTIERMLVTRLVEVVLADAKKAFNPLTEVDFDLDRIETNPRFAAIAQPANAAILVKFRVDMEDRGGRCELMLPYATLEPIRKMLLQNFMGEKFGNDNIWEGHLATEMWAAPTQVRVVMDEFDQPLGRMMTLEVGDTLLMNAGPNSKVSLRCGEVYLTDGEIGRIGNKVAVRVENPLPGVARNKLMEEASK